MPKQTFFNLPKEKRETIVNAAVDEFASMAWRTHPPIGLWKQRHFEGQFLPVF
jgi:hypothetical protein